MIRALLAALLLAATPVSVVGAGPVSGETDGDRVRVRGTLVASETQEVAPDHSLVDHDGDSFVFESSEGRRFQATVEGDNWHILSDPQLAERLWEIEGEWVSDGVFAAKKIFTVKDGALFQVTYYCEICNITSFRPGRCMCCQEDVELREIPAE